MGWSNPGPARQVVIAGPNAGEMFVYSPSPGPGNLILAIAAASGTDPYGNNFRGGLGFTNGLSAPGISSINWDISTGTVNGPTISSTFDGTNGELDILGPNTPALSAGEVAIDNAGTVGVRWDPSLNPNAFLGLGVGSNSIRQMQRGKFNVSFAAVNSVSGTLTFPVQFYQAAIPFMKDGLIVGANNDILINWQSVSSTTAAWRVFQKSGVAVTTTITVMWEGTTQ